MNAPRYIYICSAGHSGSTLLDLLLGSHSRIASPDEIDQFSENIALITLCSCGVPIHSCPLWSEVARRISTVIGVDALSHPYDLRMGHPRAPTATDRSHQTALYVARSELVPGFLYVKLCTETYFLRLYTRSTESSFDNNVQVFEAARELFGARVILFSSKSYLKVMSLCLRHPECVRILLLTRDGRAALSYNLKYRQLRKSTTLVWQRQYKRVLPLLRRHVPTEPVPHLPYKILTIDPRSTLRHVCEFVYLAFEEGLLDFRSKAHQVANGNRMHMFNSSEIGPDYEWQSRLMPDDLRSFERRAGSLNRTLGYT